MHFPADPVVDDLDQFPAEYLTDLPVPFRFLVQLSGMDGVFTIVTWELPEPRGAEHGAIVLDRHELEALVAGLQAERIQHEDLRLLCDRKQGDGQVRLNVAEALGGAQPPDASERIDRMLGLPSLLARVGAEVVAAEPRSELPLVATCAATAASACAVAQAAA